MIQLTTKKPPSRPVPTNPAEEALDLLLACHDRIRRFSDAAVMIASAPLVPFKELQDAARAIHRYFSVALPLHVADEDFSLASRLVPLARRPVRDAIARVAQDHGAIDGTLQTLLGHWRTLIEEPGRLRELPLLAPSQGLRTAFERHLKLEESLIFPLVLKLPEDGAVRVISEMRARRSPSARRATDALA